MSSPAPPGDSDETGNVTFILGGHHEVRHECHHHLPERENERDPKQSFLSPQRIAFDAMHTSAQRFPPPSCHPGTRDAVLELLGQWITSSRSSQSIMWLYGTAGVGKSAVMQTICENFLKPSGRVPAAFFFGRGQGKREQGDFLARTIAFQLVGNLPGYKASLDAVLAANPYLHKQSIAVQFKVLLVDAINSLHPWVSWNRFFGVPITIVVDGLDECQGEETQATIVKLLHNASRKFKGKLRFLVSSRPESQILAAFNDPSIAHMTRRVPLNDTFRPAEDIRLYFRAKFTKFASANPGRVPALNWPGEGVIEILVQAASGQFMYAQLVIAFVFMPRQDPQRQLKIVLDASQNAVAFSPLDALYTQVLDNIPLQQRPVLARLLGCIVVLAEPQFVPELADLASVGEADARTVLDQLRAVLQCGVGDPSALFEGPIRFAHASFRDYLVDPQRSGHYAVDQSHHHTMLALRYLEFEPSNPQLTVNSSSHDTAVNASVNTYLTHRFAVHVQNANTTVLDNALMTRARALLDGNGPRGPSTPPDSNPRHSSPFAQWETLTNILPHIVDKAMSRPFDALYTTLLDRLPEAHKKLLQHIWRHILAMPCPPPTEYAAYSLRVPPSNLHAAADLFPHLLTTTSSFDADTDKARSPSWHRHQLEEGHTRLNADFKSFLLDPSRSGGYAISEGVCRGDFVLHCFKAWLAPRNELDHKKYQKYHSLSIRSILSYRKADVCKLLGRVFPPPFDLKKVIPRAVDPISGRLCWSFEPGVLNFVKVLSVHVEGHGSECPYYGTNVSRIITSMCKDSELCRFLGAVVNKPSGTGSAMVPLNVPLQRACITFPY